MISSAIKRNQKAIWRIILLAALVAAIFYFSSVLGKNDEVKNIVSDYGYAGIFAVAFVSGFNLAVPIPAVAFMPLFLGAGSNFWTVLFIITAGMTAADFTAYVLSRVGRDIIAFSADRKVFGRMEKWRERHLLLPIIALALFAAFIPLPNEILLIPMGFLGYRSIQILPAVFFGNFVFNTLYTTGLIFLYKLI